MIISGSTFFVGFFHAGIDLCFPVQLPPINKKGWVAVYE